MGLKQATVIKKHSRAAVAALAAALVLLCSCGQGTAQAAPDAETRQWLQQAALDARESPQQLYEAAKTEGTLVVCSTSSRVLDAKESFEAQYPGLVVEVYDLRSPEIKAMLQNSRPHTTPAYDVVICADNDGTISQNFAANGILHKYVPWDIRDKLLYENGENHLLFIGEAEIAFYNGALFDEAPFTNWWQLTEPEFSGRVYIPDPQRSDSAYGLIATIATRPDLMAEAYEAYYGEALEDGVHAGEEYLRRLVKNGLNLLTSSDDVVEAVAGPGVTEPRVGFIISSKLRLNGIGYNLQPVLGMQPFGGVFAPNSIMLAAGGKHVNAAKLFVRWVLGEADGTGEGAKPFLQQGTCSVRSDITGPWDGIMQEVPLITLDRKRVYENHASFLALWLGALEEAQAL